MKVEVINAQTPQDLQELVNEFLKDNPNPIIDIRFTESNIIKDAYITKSFTAYISYKDRRIGGKIIQKA